MTYSKRMLDRLLTKLKRFVILTLFYLTCAVGAIVFALLLHFLGLRTQ